MIIPDALLAAQQTISSLYFQALATSVGALDSFLRRLGLPDTNLGQLNISEFVGVGVEFGANGQLADDLALVVYTKSEIAGWEDNIAGFFPSLVPNVVVKWRRTGTFQPLAAAQPALVRPATPGMSIGPDALPALAGTLGAVVQNAAGLQFILSCNHVLAPDNRSEPGLKILQPSLVANPAGSLNNVIATMGTLDLFCQLQALPTVSNGDFAIAQITGPGVVQAATPPGMPRLASAQPLSPADFQQNHSNKKLFKYGGATQLTTGRLITLDADFTLLYEGFIAGFQQKYIVVSDDQRKPHFAEPGDSGSLVVTEDGFAVGLAFAIDQNVQGGPDTVGLDTVVCPLDQLFGQLGLSFVIPPE
jgi:hypothetical protein